MPTATVSDLLSDALYMNGAFGAGDDISADDMNLTLRTCNRMLASWGNERQMIFGISRETFTMTPGTADYSTTLLPNGRPVQIASIVVQLSNIFYEVELIDDETFNAIPYKIVQSIPSQCYYDQAYPNGTMSFYPIPYAAFTCYVSMLRTLTSPLTLNGAVSLPEGYEMAIVSDLSCMVAPSFGRPVTQDMKDNRDYARTVIRVNNYVPLRMKSPLEEEYDPSTGFIYKGF